MRLETAMEMGRGIIRTSDHLSLRASCSRAVKRGELLYALPAVVMDVRLKDSRSAWIRAVHAWNPNAVIAGTAAAKLTFSPDVNLKAIRVLAPTKIEDRGPLRFARNVVPADLVNYFGDIRVTSADVTAITAGMDGDYEPGTTALRKRIITPDSLTAAAARWTPRPGRALSTTVDVLSTNPWSVAEVDAHQLLIASGVSGWVANPELVIQGKVVHPDIALLRSRIAFEVNSYAHHSSRQEMERDAARMNLLISAGWRVFVLTPNQIRDYPEETAEFIRNVVPQRHQRNRRVLNPGSIS